MVTVYPSTVEREYIVRNGFLHAGMETFNMKRVFLIVLDSVGIGEMPDAADYGDAGSTVQPSMTTAGLWVVMII